MEFTVNQIAELIGGEVVGDGTATILKFGKIQEAGEGDISFLSNPKYEHYIYDSQASAIIVNKSFEHTQAISATLIKVEDAYASFTVLLEAYNKMTAKVKKGVENPSFIADSASIGENHFRGAFSYIGENTRIGENVQVYPSAYIGDDVAIGDNTIIYAGAKIYDGTQIGANCVIHAGAVLGSDGFGFAPQKDGTYQTIPQMGKVILEDNVSIGANTVIDKATFPNDATRIKDGTKLDNLVQIAHNVVIGKNTVIAAQTGISGSTELGDNCVVGGQVGVVGHVKIHDKTTLAAKAGISKGTRQEGEVLFGYPAFNLKEYMSSYAMFKQLPDINRRLRELEKKG